MGSEPHTSAAGSAGRSMAQAVFLLQERLKGHPVLPRRRELERTQWLSPGQLEDAAVGRLREFLVRAGRRVPYYRKLFGEADFHPEKLAGVIDLQRLPLLDKPAIRQNADALRAVDAHRLREFQTGGSSGEPLIFQLSPERVTHDVAAKWRATRWWSVDIGDPEAVVWGSPIELGGQDRVKQWRDRLLRTRLFPAFGMSEANMDRFLDGIRAMRARMLFGYPSALAKLAGHARRRNRTMDDLPLRVAFVTGERLYPEQRSLISEVFGCPVANGYGGRDAGFIAHECQAGGMHISAEDIIVEIVDGDGRPLPDGQPGEIVVTHMATGDYPFIRYRTGDVATRLATPCECGRGLPLLTDIQGRSTDFVVAADGTSMHGLALIYVLRELPGVGEFKIIQESLEHTRVLMVADAQRVAEFTAPIQEGFRRRLGAGVRVDVEAVAEIPPERSGKYRYVVSRVAEAGG